MHGKLAMILAGVLTGLVSSVFGQDGAELLNARCSSCHAADASGSLSRVVEVRKSPEGWDMTIVRMMLLHGVQIDADERRQLVKHLADTQGLAPAEASGYRYALERQPAAIESPDDEEIAVMCARCHTYARVALQRRSEAEWLRLAHFHLGQYPTIEYQALARDRNWWEIASEQLPAKLAEKFPLASDDWNQWRERIAGIDVAGTWRVVGDQPGKGRFYGHATITRAGDAGSYSISQSLVYADGSTVEASGAAELYAGFEWRAGVNQGEGKVLQVLALNEDATTLTGRWFFEDSDSLGGPIRMFSDDSGPQVLAVEPPYLKAGQSTDLTIYGIGLQAGSAVDFGPGIEVGAVTDGGTGALQMSVSAAADAPAGAREVHVGDLSAGGLFTVYQQIDSLRVEPDNAIARVGGNGGPIPPVPAQFDAVAYLNGDDDQPGTDDDIRIGSMAAQWAVDNATEMAAAMKDMQFAGTIQGNGLFMPADAGPNAERRYSTNNVGELTVIATVGEGDAQVSGQGRLIVTVQRWNDPPIR